MIEEERERERGETLLSLIHKPQLIGGYLLKKTRKSFMELEVINIEHVALVQTSVLQKKKNC